MVVEKNDETIKGAKDYIKGRRDFLDQQEKKLSEALKAGKEKEKAMRTRLTNLQKKIEELNINTPIPRTKIISKTKGALIGALMAGGLIYGAQSERIQEAFSTMVNEGPDALIEQTENYLEQEKEAAKAKEVSMLKRKKDSTEQAKDNFVIKEIGPVIIDDANRFRTPLVINLTKENRFNYRNRGDQQDINNTDGAMISTFKPFSRTTTYQNILADDKDSSTVIALNTSTGRVTAGKFMEFKNNPEYVVSETRAAKEIIGIKIDKSNEYIPGIYQKGIALIMKDSSNASFPLGIGKDASGNFLGGYSGGKILIFSPDKKHGWFVYGTANMLKEQIEEFKKTYTLDYVLRFDLDLKAYAQTIQTKNKKISGRELIALDNYNSSKAGAGNILYLDNNKQTIAGI